MNSMKKITWWLVCKISVLILLLLAFTPLITPSGVFKPSFFGLPYTLWVGMIHAMVIVCITWIATQVHPGKND